jgi:hypothetical protein
MIAIGEERIIEKRIENRLAKLWLHNQTTPITPGMDRLVTL